MTTIHGATIYNAWIDAGGTHESWITNAVPELRKQGTGPLYRFSDETLAELLAKAK